MSGGAAKAFTGGRARSRPSHTHADAKGLTCKEVSTQRWDY